MGRPDRHRATWAAALAVLVLACGSASALRAQVAEESIEPARAAIRLKNYAEAVQRLRVLADRGDPQAQYLLACLYRAGLGVQVDDAQARALLLAAAEKNNAQAAYSLAMSFANEEPRDLVQAQAWVKRASDAGHLLARAAFERGALPLEFLPQSDLGDLHARRAALWLAAQHDDAELASALLDRQMLERTDDFGRGVLAIAAQAGAGRTVKVLLERGASPDQADAFGVTPLMLAARSGHERVVDILLHARPPLDAVDRVGNSALMHAAASGKAPIVHRLLQAGANISLRNAQGWSALDWAVQADSQPAAELLRQQGLSTRLKPARVAGSPAIPLLHASNAAGDLYKGIPDAQIAASRSSPALFKDVIEHERSAGRPVAMPDGVLFAAAVTGSPAAIETVLAAGAKAAGPSDPLSWLATRGEPDALAAVLAHRADTPAGRTAPLLAAVSAGRMQAVRVLLEAHGDTEVRDAMGRTPLMLAAAHAQADMARQLLSHLARGDQVDKLGRTALWYASAAGSTDIASALLTQKELVDARDVLGFTPLAIASSRGHAAVVDGLVKAGANPNVATQSDSTPLMLAAAGGHTAIVARLLAAGARIDQQNRHGDTALIVAVRNGQLDTVRHLLSAGASDKLRNGDRASALDVSSGLALAAITELLQRD